MRRGSCSGHHHATRLLSGRYVLPRHVRGLAGVRLARSVPGAANCAVAVVQSLAAATTRVAEPLPPASGQTATADRLQSSHALSRARARLL